MKKLIKLALVSLTIASFALAMEAMPRRKNSLSLRYLKANEETTKNPTEAIRFSDKESARTFIAEIMKSNFSVTTNSVLYIPKSFTLEGLNFWVISVIEPEDSTLTNEQEKQQ
ncbi:TPA: hypothetical protein DEO28_05165 [Candidatus Dependentiae bacterium]|nr:MAG: hypothetical protein UR14_C0002G0146 [candidate division TM6 bacterium GW2011_GWE2_31_21]KKP53943.1 MAG: hypothetical protein UR43_C0002G0146 [candidate division TM6 bacterium GW2011_GWF2_33_332]HBS47723.1 hypothetical protein [Candidatus Dependentiae bacterium]HBZ73872.1 hypothetical protein [Candidatus Dependentiae bacterium]